MKFTKLLLFVLCLILNECRTQTPPTKANFNDFLTTFRNWNDEKSGKIPQHVAAPFLGHGGTYESVYSFTWRHKTVEPSHAPHYSILEYVDPSKLDLLPENIRKAVKTRKELEAQLATTNHPQNEERMKALKQEIDELMTTLNKLVPVNEWGNNTLAVEFLVNMRKMTSTHSEIMQLEIALKSNPSGDPQLEIDIATLKNSLNDLQQRKLFLRTEAEKKIKTAENRAKLEILEGEYKTLENENKELSKALEVHIENIKKTMGVLTIPYDMHHIFPHICLGDVNEDIRALKNADSNKAKALMEEYDKSWKLDIDDGIQKGFINPGNDFQLVEGKTAYDYEAIWKNNFDKLIKAVETGWMEMESSTGKTTTEYKKKWSSTPAPVEQEYLTRVHLSYAKKFIITTIYFIKTPETGYSRLMNLYIEEYKLYMRNYFKSYKRGISQLLETNKQFGWITENDVNEIRNYHNLKDLDLLHSSDSYALEMSNEWNVVQELAQLKSETSSNPLIPEGDPGLTSLSSSDDIVCSASTRRKRSASETQSCFIISKGKVTDIVNFDPKRYLNEIGLPKPKIHLPSDADTVFINSKRLTNYLIDFNSDDINSILTREAVVEFLGRNSDKLNGTLHEIAAVKAMLKQEDLESHAEQISLGTQILGESDVNFISTKAVVKYKQVKVSTRKVATKVGKITDDIIRISKPNKKIMLAKGVVSALRHGDYESLALTGGSIGLEAVLSGVAKLGKHIAQNITTKFMTTFGSTFLGKVAGPIGSSSDTGLNIYFLEKSVKILNDPNATKVDINEAIVQVLADSMNLALTATTADLSPTNPPRIPVSVDLMFVSNLHKAAAFHEVVTHVDRLNKQTPSLDFDETGEYMRDLIKWDTSDIIQEQDLIDTTKANDIAVNLTVPFWKYDTDTDLIGKVFPSKARYQAAPCRLEEKACNKLMFFIPLGCGDWESVSNCTEYDGYCDGNYSHTKCQNSSDPRFFVLIPGHSENEYHCKCGDNPPSHWGHEIQDSEVNFRYRRSVYLQQTALSETVPPGFSYLCKPSSLYRKGERSSLRSTEIAYYCKGAIGFKRTNNQGKFMLYDLGNGTDSVYLDTSETVDNLFVVKDGHKKYEGNAGDDTFILDGPCNYLRGRLDGKGYKSQGNSLVLGSNCRSDSRLEVNFQSGKMYFGEHYIALRNIHRLFGRQGKSDIVRASCSTTLIVGSGGKSALDPDEIYLPSLCGSSTEMTVALEGSATVYVTSFSKGNFYILLENTGLSFKAIVPRALVQRKLVFKFQENVGRLASTTILSRNRKVIFELKFQGGGTATFEVSPSTRQINEGCNKATGENSIQILITENGQIFRRLRLILGPPPPKLQAVHVLEEGASSRIQGYDFMDNVFHLRSGHWHVSGGKRHSNLFILSSFQFSGSISGSTSSRFNILNISDNLRIIPFLIDLNSEEISSDSNEGKITVKNIQRLVGRPEYVEEVVVSCAIKYQYMELGGNSRDIVTIPRIYNCSPEINISAKGKLTLEDRKFSGAITVEVGYFDQSCFDGPRDSLDLHIQSLGGGYTTLLLNFPIFAVTAASLTFLTVDGVGGGQVLINGSFPTIYFEEDYKIKSALFVNDGKLQAFHELKIQRSMLHTPKLRKGSKIIPNSFKLENGVNWTVEGGNEGDAFSLASSNFSGSINGLDGRNRLFIGNAITGDVEVKQSELHRNGKMLLKLKSIQEIHGRTGQPEKVEVGCDMLQLALNGGNGRKPDQIIIPDSYSSCNTGLNLTILGEGFIKLDSVAMAHGQIDTYLSTDVDKHLLFNANIQVSANLTFNFPIQLPSHKLSSYLLSIGRTENSNVIESVQLKINLKDDGNFLDFTLKGDHLLQNIKWMFVDEDFNSNGNIFINTDADEIQVLHVLQKTGSTQQRKVIRRGAIGAKNVFRLHTGTWDAFGGALDDSFVLNDIGFKGKIHGLQSINSLILSDNLNASLIAVDLSKNTFMFERSQSITVKSIQIVVGRKQMKEIISCGCDTKLIMSEGGGLNESEHDEIYITDQPCPMEMMDAVVMLTDFTRVQNLARKGNFTYHVRAFKSSTWDIRYIATDETNHLLKLEMDMEKVKVIGITSEENDGKLSRSFQINFTDGGSKEFPLNYQRLPNMQIGLGPELMTEILFPDEEMAESSLSSSIVARTPFSGSVHGFHGVKNEIVVQTSNSLQGIFGGDKGDKIFLTEVDSILVINANEGKNLLQFSDELQRGNDFEVDLQREKIKFIKTSTDFVTVVKGINFFVGREHSFERVTVGCDTKSVKWADEVTITNWNCGYDVKIEVGSSTRVMFESMGARDKLGLPDDEEIAEDLGETEETDLEIDNSDDIVSYLEPSVFHYHFSAIRSFDIEVKFFKSFRDTRHVFYLNFTLTNLTSIRFSLNESRLIYSTFHDSFLEYSHLVGKLEDTAMFYSHPEFMTNDGFLLRITRYGEIMAVLGSSEETFELDYIHYQTIPGLSALSERLGISFMFQRANDFIYTGSPLVEEVDLLTNRMNTTSHLIGWNGTTYEILNLEKDTWIYPQQIQEASIHVIDLSNIVSQIRSDTGRKYIPEVKENGVHLEIVMTNWTTSYPASVVITNGTRYGNVFVVMLKSIAMVISPDSAAPHKWKMTPKPISVPKGHAYMLSKEDLEDDVVINLNDASRNSIKYTMKNLDLVITSINNTLEDELKGRFTSFGIYDFYKTRIHFGDETNTIKTSSNNIDIFTSVDSINNVIVNLGLDSVNITSNAPILKKETGEEVLVEPYEDVLGYMEEEMLDDFPDIPRRFNQFDRNDVPMQ